MLKYIILIFILFLEDYFAYKIIRNIDKKERIKLNNEEIEHVNEMIKKYKELDKLENKTCSSK